MLQPGQGDDQGVTEDIDVVGARKNKIETAKSLRDVLEVL